MKYYFTVIGNPELRLYLNTGTMTYVEVYATQREAWARKVLGDRYMVEVELDDSEVEYDSRFDCYLTKMTNLKTKITSVVEVLSMIPRLGGLAVATSEL